MRSLSTAAHPSPFPPGSTQGADSPLPQNPEISLDPKPYDGCLPAEVRKILAANPAGSAISEEYGHKFYLTPGQTLAAMLADAEPGSPSHIGQVGMNTPWWETQNQLLAIAVSAGRGQDVAAGLVHDAMLLAQEELQRLAQRCTEERYPRLQARFAQALHEELAQLLQEWDALRGGGSGVE